MLNQPFSNPTLTTAFKVKSTVRTGQMVFFHSEALFSAPYKMAFWHKAYFFVTYRDDKTGAILCGAD